MLAPLTTVVTINQEKSEVILNQKNFDKEIKLRVEKRRDETLLIVEIRKSRSEADDRRVRAYFPRIITKAKSKIDANLFTQINKGKEEESSAIGICLTHELKDIVKSEDIQQLTKNLVEISQALQLQ